MLEKSPLGLKENLARVTLALLVLGIFTSVVAIAPVANAQSYPHVPTLAPSTLTPTPSAAPISSSTAPPLSSPTEFPWNFPSNNPTKNPTVESSGFLSPLTIGIVVVALVAFTVPAVFFYARRGKQKMLLDEEHPFNTQELPGASNRSSVSSRHNQPSYSSTYQSQTTKPVETKQYGQPPSYGYRPQPSSPSVITRSAQPSSYSQPPPYTKICPHCKRAVRNDQNVCPYCDKKLR